MARSVQKIRITERDVGGAGPHLLSNILEHDRLGNQKEPTLVHWHDGAMQAMMLAPATRLDVADHLVRPVPFKLRIASQRRKVLPKRDWKLQRRAFQERRGNLPAETDPVNLQS